MKRALIAAGGVLLAAAAAYAWQIVGATNASLPLRLLGDYPLSGHATRFDYAAIDQPRRLLWLAHMGDGSVEAFDLRADRVAVTLPISPGASVRGILVADGRVYAAAQGVGSVVVFEREKRIATTRAGDVDGLAYDPRTRRVFVSDEAGGREMVIDARTNRRIGAVELGGEAGNTQYDGASAHIFVGVQTRDELAEIDPVALRVVRRYPLPGCRSSHSVTLDSEARAAFIGCQHNMRIVRLDLLSGRVTGTGGVGVGVDVLALDPVLHRLYAASESGIVSVYDVADGKLRRVAQALLHLNAHVVAVDPSTHRVYFPLQDVGGRPVLRVMTPR